MSGNRLASTGTEMNKPTVAARPSREFGERYYERHSSVVVTFPIPNTDFGLVDALRADHPNAKQVLCNRYTSELLTIAARILGPDEDVRASVIKNLKQSLEHLNELTEPRAFRLWLVSRLVASLQRTLRTRRFRGLFRREGNALTVEMMRYSERLIVTYRLLNRLPVDQRVAFCLVVICSMRLTEAANILGISLSVLENRLAATHSNFRRLSTRYYPNLLRRYSSHASLGSDIATEQDQLFGDVPLCEFDLL
jgi:RNA polymerase sigma-70 factor (ECF subfamily)